MSAAQRRKRRFKLKPAHLLLLLLVFSISVAATTTVTSRLSQLAVAKEADMKCTPGKDYQCACGTPKEKCKAKKLPGGKDCPCNDETNGHTTPGKCQDVNICKGDPKGDGKGGEPPKMPEPPKSEPKKDEPPKSDPCAATGAGGNNTFGAGQTPETGASSTPKYDANGQPCPKNPSNPSPISSLINSIWGTDVERESTTTATTTPETATKKFSWTAVVRTLARDASEAVTDTANAVASGVSNVAESIGTSLGYGTRTDVVSYGASGNTQGSTPEAGVDTSVKTFAQTTGFNAPSDAGVSGNQVGSPQPESGFWDWAKTQLQNFLNKF